MGNHARVAVFIDNSNVFHNLHDFKKVDPQWVCLYNPLHLAQKLAGSRKLSYVGFYCVRPPSYLLEEGDVGKMKYSTSMQYYAEIEKLPTVTVKYGSLKGSRGDLVEKNLDTQLATDMVKMAALNEFDVAIIVSNDGDYVPPVQAIKKQFDKKVEVGFFKGSLSMALKKECDLSRRLRPVHFQRIFPKNTLFNSLR